MTVTDFLQHWSLTENPFRGEEARTDTVFSRMSTPGVRPVQVTNLSTPALALSASDAALYHSDFDKIMGDLRKPPSAVVFGEKGSGKTAIRLQMARKVSEHNVSNPGAKVLMVSYDDLNAALDRLHDRVGGKTYLDSLQKVRLVDHMDAILNIIVPKLVDALLGHVPQGDVFELPSDAKKSVRKLDRMMRRDVLLLQALYDRPEHAPERTLALRRKLGIWPAASIIGGNLFLYLAPLAILAGILMYRAKKNSVGLGLDEEQWWKWGLLSAVGAYSLIALKFGILDRVRLLRKAHRVKRQIRVVPRGDMSYAKSLRFLPLSLRDSANLPVTDADTPRYAAFDRLRRVLRCFGYTGMVIVIDRVDEPTLVGGDPDRMKAIVWPMLSNKFLQQEGVGVKLLLPMELQHALMRESAAFFQEARLDKQHLVEHLAWTGPMLYDLCEARLNACRLQDTPPLQLIDLFSEDVSKADLIESFEKVRQPRDTFKFVYRCMTEHCATFTRGQSEWRVTRSTLLGVLKGEQMRVAQVLRGIRPA